MEKRVSIKKIIAITTAIVVLLGVFAVIYFVGFNKENKIIDLEVSEDKIVLNVGDKVDLKNYYITKPVNISANVSCLPENSGLAVISTDNVLTAKGVGETKIYLKVNSGDDVIEKNIVLQIEESLIIPSELSFKSENISLMLTDVGVTNKLTINGDYNCTPQVEYSCDDVCEYEPLSGNIIPKSIGSTTVTVTFSNGKNYISKSFYVEVKTEIKKEIILSDNNLLTKTEQGYHISCAKGAMLSVTMSYYEDDIKQTCQYSITDLTEKKSLTYQQDANILMMRSGEVGTNVLKIEVVGKEKFIILTIEVK